MLLDLALVDAPATPVLSLADAKAHLNIVESDDDDDLVEALIDAAIARLDGYAGILGRALVTQTWALRLPGFYPDDGRWLAAGDWWRHVWRSSTRWQAIHLPLPPLQSVASIAYVDPDGADQTLDPAAYVVLDGALAQVRPAPLTSWPPTQCDNARAVTITFVAGYGDAAADVPRPISAAMKLLVGHWYRNREAVVGVDARDSSTELPIGVSALLAPYRLIPV